MVLGAAATSVGTLAEVGAELRLTQRREEEGLGGMSVGTSVGAAAGVSEVLDDVRLVAVREAESARGSDERLAGGLGVILGVCAGVGSCGSEHTGGPSATYHTSLCLLRSLKGLHARTHAHNVKCYMRISSSNKYRGALKYDLITFGLIFVPSAKSSAKPYKYAPPLPHFVLTSCIKLADERLIYVVVLNTRVVFLVLQNVYIYQIVS